MDDSGRLLNLVASLSLAEKVSLVSGASFWTTTALPSIGLRAMVFSDGPSGVRGPVWDERLPSLSMPSASALAASWDPEMAYLYGVVAAGEARRKGVDVVLGPTINLHRSPLGGRHFEAFSEDPVLSGTLAAAYVRGLQDNGVAATPKHFVANDSETDRFTIDIALAPRALHELYLRPFELAVDAGAWVMMIGYNSVGGVTMTENALITNPLRTVWGFDGVLLSDWTAVRSLTAATAGMDLAMPGPVTAWSATLADAVADGRVAEAVVDRKVLSILRLADRVGALQGSAPKVPVEVELRAFAKQAAVEGTVLLENRNELPWDASQIRSIAVIGQHARSPRIQGGGSATVVPELVVSPLDGIRAALPYADLHYEVGAALPSGLEEFALQQLTNPRTGEPGVRVTFLSEAGEEIFVDDRRSTSLVWVDGDAPLERTRTIVLETVYLPAADEEVQIGFASAQHGRVFADGVLLIDDQLPIDGDDVGRALMSPPWAAVAVSTFDGVPIALRAEFDVRDDDPLPGAASVTLGRAPMPLDPAQLIAGAVAAARRADVVVIVVGTTPDVESEGVDRTSLALPGHQDDLVRAVAAVNSRTVVVVNAGAPVLMPWRKQVAGVLLGYFGGQEMGAAVASILVGDDEPGGRLTTTWAAETSDIPILSVTPSQGILEYREGLNIGYRAWLASAREPAYEFGWGLGYTTWAFAPVDVIGTIDDDDLVLRVTATNTGQREGKNVVQVYAERAESAIDRPPRWLAASAVVRLAPGASAEMSIPIPRRTFAHWDDDVAWSVEPGIFTVRAGTSVGDLPLSFQVVATRAVTE